MRKKSVYGSIVLPIHYLQLHTLHYPTYPTIVLRKKNIKSDVVVMYKTNKMPTFSSPAPITIYRLTGNGKVYYGSTSRKLLTRVKGHLCDVTCVSYTSGITTAVDLSWNAVEITDELNRYDRECFWIENYECVNKSRPRPPVGHPRHIPRTPRTHEVKMANEMYKQAVRYSRREELLNKPRNIIKDGKVYHINEFGECKENMEHDPYFFVTTTPFGKATQKNELYMRNRSYVEEKLESLKHISSTHNYNCPDCGAVVCVPSQSVLRRHFASKKHLFALQLITKSEQKYHFQHGSKKPATTPKVE